MTRRSVRETTVTCRAVPSQPMKNQETGLVINLCLERMANLKPFQRSNFNILIQSSHKYERTDFWQECAAWWCDMSHLFSPKRKTLPVSLHQGLCQGDINSMEAAILFGCNTRVWSLYCSRVLLIGIWFCHQYHIYLYRNEMKMNVN